MTEASLDMINIQLKNSHLSEKREELFYSFSFESFTRLLQTTKEFSCVDPQESLIYYLTKAEVSPSKTRASMNVEILLRIF